MANKVEIVVTDEGIYFANTGRPIDRRGVISITNQYLSTKGEGSPDDLYHCDDGELVDEIRKQRLELYALNLNDLKAHANEENATRRDYAGRSLWELLQNADDAMAPAGSPSSELIGAKGLGFKSVLELTDRPEMYSGPFHFTFDPDRSATMLGKLVADPPKLVFRLPHASVPDRLVKSLRSKGFETVVKLPHKNEVTRGQAEEHIRGLAPHFLLLCQHLRSIEIKFSDGRTRRMIREGGGLDGAAIGALLTIVDGEESRSERWRIWSRLWESPADGSKRLSAAIAIQVEGKVAIPASSEIPVHVFFPTQEALAAPFLVHAAFELRSDRNHLLAGSRHQETLLEALGSLAAQAVRYLEPASALELFRPLAKLPGANVVKLDRKIERALGNGAHDTQFVPTHGGRLVRPREARLWSHDLVSVLDHRINAVKQARLCTPTVLKAKTALEAFGAHPLRAQEYAQLLSNVRCSSLDECVIAAGVARHACLEGYVSDQMLEDVAKGAFWFTRKGDVRPLTTGRPLVRSRPPAWPSWLAADDLNPEFASRAFPDGQKDEAKWAPLLQDRLLSSTDDLIVHCLAPAIEGWSDQHWSENGWEVIETLHAWLPELDWTKIAPFLPGTTIESRPRAALAAVAKVPLGSIWVAAVDAYASGEIGGSHELADFFRSRAGRSVVGRPARASVIDKDRWRALLRYMGVSWEPKIRTFDNSSDGSLVSYERYRERLDSSLRYRRKDWYLDWFPDCLKEVTPSRLFRMLPVLMPGVSQVSAEYWKQWGSTVTHRPQPFSSCADYQLRLEAYLPCRPSFAHSANRAAPPDLYWPGCGIAGITPTLDLGTFPNAERKRLRKLLVSGLDLQDKLPDGWEPWLHWADKLADHVAAGERISTRPVRDFYEAFVSHDFKTIQPRIPKRIIGETQKGLVVTAGKEAVWIDEPRFATREVMDALLGETAIFPPMLNRGRGAVERLKTLRASDVVSVTPSFVEALKETAILERRLKSRRLALAAVGEQKGERWVEPGKLRAVRSLSLKMRLGDNLMATQTASAFRAENIWLINLDAGAWDGLGFACADSFRNATDLRLWFTQILKAEDDEVRSILREGGIPGYRLDEITIGDEEEPSDTVEPTVTASGQGASPSAPFALPLPAAADAFQPTNGSGDNTGGEPSDVGHPGLGTSGGATSSRSRTPAQAPITSRSGKLRKRPLYDPGRSDEGHHNAGGPSRSIATEAAARARQLGFVGEEWFAERIAQSMRPGWTPSFNVWDDENRESDVLLSFGEAEWHIEIKTLGTERIYWSGLEHQKAQNWPDRYLMAFLVPDSVSSFKIYWSWDPLKDLLPCDRRIDWVWSGSDPGPQLPEDSWKPLSGLKRPERSPDRMNFAIRVDQNFLDARQCDTDALGLLWGRINSGRDSVRS